MQDMTHEERWETLAELYAFLGNSLLRPMTQTARAGLSAEFWEAVPDFGDAAVRAALDGCAEYARSLMSEVAGEEEAALRVSVEYTHLFVGPPAPAAAPWETMYGGAGVKVGFGEPTHLMREELRRLGLAQGGSSNQYEDHMGIELLCLSEICRRVAAGECAATDAQAFATRRPAKWVDAFRARVAEHEPDGYIAHVLDVARALLMRWG